jgi:hypothetical protein
MGESNDPTTPLPDLNLVPVDVHIDGLDDFRAFLGRELDANLRPGVTTILADHILGVQFGVNIAGTGIQSARSRYHESLQAAATNLSTYVQVAEVLVETLHRVVDKYRESDLSSAAIFTELATTTDEMKNESEGTLSIDSDAEARRELPE